jgi:hypothetical protein
MKQLLGIVLAVLIVVIAVPYARSLGSSSAPPGVSAGDWIPFGDAAGFVIVHDSTVSAPIRPTAGTIKGYLMVRRKDSWLRVDSAPDYGVQNAGMPR